MPRLTLRRAIDTLHLVERRARGQEPGDDALSRLRLGDARTDPLAWLGTIAAKLAVVLVLAMASAGLFAGGTALMRVLGVAR